MRAVVTGATGFVGAAVVRALLREDAQVVCLVRRGSEVRHLRDPRITLMEGDLLDEASLRRAFRGCEQVYHVAAFYSTRAEDEGRLFEVNVGGTANVLRAAEEAGAQRIVHTSTIGTIGRPAGRLPTEADRFQNIERASPYARSKLEAEQLALESAERGLPVVVVNPCAPVGVGDVKPSSTGQRIVAYLRGRVPSFPAGGINFVSVEDVAVGHLLAARK
ncbi:MAG: NAD-dependent epimerase/dehydratase family protein, partial [Chloroflexi bacterium]|nr:NAD-dependent epimerase/dehydratase family protein [Chloroflexota bacterium]